MDYYRIREFLEWIVGDKEEITMDKNICFSHKGENIGDLSTILENYEEYYFKKWYIPRQRSRYKNKNTLFLLTEKRNVELIASGKKKIEYRRYSDWIGSRLIDYNTGEIKFYQYIKLTTMYNHGTPYVICKFEGFEICKEKIEPIVYDNGFVVNNIGPEDFIIHLGEVVETGNL